MGSPLCAITSAATSHGLRAVLPLHLPDRSALSRRRSRRSRRGSRGANAPGAYPHGRTRDGDGMTTQILDHTGTSSDADLSRIAVFQALNLGDLLCTTPALRAIRRRFPAAEITFIGRPWAEDFVARLSTAGRFLPFPGYPGIAESPTDPTPPVPRWPRFDLVIQMHGSGEVSNGFVAALGATRSVGFGPPGDARLTTALSWVESESEPLRWLRLAAAIGAAPADRQIEFPLTPAERSRAAALIGPPDGRPVIGLHVGASDPSRRWPAESFANLGDILAERHQARIVLTGSDQERPLTASVRRSMKRPAI